MLSSLPSPFFFILILLEYSCLPGGASGKETACQCRRRKRRGFHPWVGKIPQRRAWQPTPVFLPSESHGQRSLADTTEATYHRCFTVLCQFLPYSKVSQLYVYIYPLCFGFPSHLGHRRAVSRVSGAAQQALISYLFYTQQCIYVSLKLPLHPTLLFSPWYPLCVFSTSLPPS